MNAQDTPVIKNQEYDLLEAIAHDPLVTQAGLSAQLGIAVGGVNWYIKRLVNVGYVKVSHLDRTRLKYHLTPAGVSALTQRTLGSFEISVIDPSLAHRVETCPVGRSSEKNSESACSVRSQPVRPGYDRLSLLTFMRDIERAAAGFMLLLPAELAAEWRG